jgi:hypothetical protein
LERCGVLLAVNDAAGGPGSDLVAADAAEQSLAHRLAEYAHFDF